MRGKSFHPLPNHIVTEINPDRLQGYLTSHPDRELVHFLVNGLTNGFDILYSGAILPTNPRNLKSARDNPDKVLQAINVDISRGHTSGPFDHPPFNIVHCSPLGAVDKSHDKVRLILDLSQPRGSSVNEAILDSFCSVKYSSFDEGVDMVNGCGPGASMAKIDIKHAFRLCPVRMADWPLLCYQFNNQFYVDTRLPFGSRSSPAIFNTLADALTWILVHTGGITNIIHYLDDFLLCARNSQICATWMSEFLRLFKELGVPISSEKTIGPSPIVTFLGIEIDAKNTCIRLPQEKFTTLNGPPHNMARQEEVHKKGTSLIDRVIVIHS